MLMNRTTPFMVPVDEGNPAIIKDEALCSQCGHCFAICEEEIGVAAKYLLNPRETYQCIGCGQCSANCPEKAIIGKPHYKIVKELIKDPDKIVVFSTSPSVRVGFADGFGKEPGTFAQDEMVGALRALGADYVFDVTFSADLTIMEEGSELLSRILKGTGPLPQFTSCCPAWVKYMENFHPDKTAHLSSAKSPIGMQGAVIKTYFAHKKHIDPEKIISVAVTPCTAKKAEIAISTWFLFFLYVEHLGERSLAVTNIVRNVSGILFMVLMAFASTCGSLVSNLIGAGHSDCVAGTIRQHVRIAYVFVLPLALLFAVFPKLILGIYTDIPDLQDAAVHSLWVMCSTYLFLVPANVYFQAVSGTGNTRTAWGLEMATLVIYTAYITYIILILQLDVAICWTSEMVYSSFILIFCWLYIKRGNWQGRKI